MTVFEIPALFIRSYSSSRQEKVKMNYLDISFNKSSIQVYEIGA